MLDVEVCRNLDKLQCPLYILHGDKDPFTPPEVEALLRKRLAGKDLTYLRVADCTHDIAAFPQGKAALLDSFRWIVRCFRS
jgi:pimeloyl-ACP methyl ester carboxylesterase